MPTAKRPPDGLYGLAWSQISEACLRPYADQENRKTGRIRERELSALAMVLTGPDSISVSVICLDVSVTGFRITAPLSTPMPTPGHAWSLQIPARPSGKHNLAVRLVWAQKRASDPFWEAGLERQDLFDEETPPANLPEPALKFETPGSAMLAYIEHPFLFQEWTQCEIVRLSNTGFLLAITHENDAVAYTGDILSLRISLPGVDSSLFKFHIQSVTKIETGLSIQGHLLNFKASHGRGIATGLRQSGLVNATTLFQAGFALAAEDSPLDVQGLALGQDTQRRVIGAFIEGKMVASLAYCLDTKSNTTHLRIEGMSLQREAVSREDVPKKLFAMAGRALLLSPFPWLQAQPDENQEILYRLAGFREDLSLKPVLRVFVLTRHDVMWGYRLPFLTWWRYYRPMVVDLLDRGFLTTPIWLRWWIRICSIPFHRLQVWP